MSGFKATATSKGQGDGDFEKAPPGNHPAVCVAIIDLGTQKETFNGKETEQRRLFFVWELTAAKMSDGRRNHIIGIDLTLSLHEKAKMRKWVQARAGRQIADGEDYDVLNELGKPCLLNVVQKGDFPKIDGITAVPAGMTVPPNLYKPFSSHIDAALRPGGNVEIPEWTPWLYGEDLAERIRRSKEILALPTKPGVRKLPTQWAGSTPPVSGGTSAPPPPPRTGQSSPPPPPHEPKFWVDLSGDPVGGGGTHPEPVSIAEAGHLLMSKGLKADTTLVCKDGGTQWVPAETVGIKLPF